MAKNLNFNACNLRALSKDDKPDNIFVTEEQDPVKAFIECKNAILSNFNVAVWDYPALNPPKRASEALEAFFMDKPSGAFNNFHFGNTNEDCLSVRSSFYEKMESSFQEKILVGSQHDSWLDFFDEISSSLPQAFNGIDSRLSLGVSNICRKDTGFPHIDMARPFKVLDDDPENPVIQSHVVILCTTFNRGTLYFDDKDFNVQTLEDIGFGWRESIPESLAGGSSIANIWYTKPFALSFHAPGPWPHDAAIHDFPYLLKGEEDDKTDWRMNTRIQGNFILTQSDFEIVRDSHPELFL